MVSSGRGITKSPCTHLMCRWYCGESNLYSKLISPLIQLIHEPAQKHVVFNLPLAGSAAIIKCGLTCKLGDMWSFFPQILMAERLLQSATVNMYANTVAHKVFKTSPHDITGRKAPIFKHTDTHSICSYTNTQWWLCLRQFTSISIKYIKPITDFPLKHSVFL